MINKILVIVLLLLNETALSQKLPILEVKEPKSNGKAKIFYRLKSEIRYIPNTFIIDWLNSIERLEKSEIWNKEGIEGGTKYFVENSVLKNGIREGKFSLQSLYLIESNSSTDKRYFIQNGETLIEGNYLKNSLHGEIKILMGKNTENKLSPYNILGEDPLKLKNEFNNRQKISNSTQTYDNNCRRISLVYDNGKINDQTVTLEFVQYKSIKINPFFKFQNGAVFESLSMGDPILFYLNQKYPSYMKFSENREEIFVTRYTDAPYCFNNFIFPLPATINMNAINKTTIECVNYKLYGDKNIGLNYRSDGVLLINGNYKLYLPNYKVLFDTTKLVAEYQFKTGKRNGEAKIWDENNNLRVTINYKGDYLDGSFKLLYSDGRPHITANFYKGYPVGDAISYYNKPDFSVFELKNIVPWKKPEEVIGWGKNWRDYGGTVWISQIGDWNESDKSSINTIRKNGGKIQDLEGYGVYSKVNYKIDSSLINGIWQINYSYASEDYLQFNKDKPMISYIIDKNKQGEFKDIKYLDETGKVVYSASQAAKEVLEELNKRKVEQEKQNNIMIHCKWCNNKFRFGDRIEVDECHCIDRATRNTVGVVLWVPLGFCSNTCRINYEKDCCRKNGHLFND